jgi:hypothetical protein
MTNSLYDNTKELIEICEALEGVKNYLTKSAYRTASLATGVATGAAMLKTGAYTKTAASNLSGNTAAEALVKLKDSTMIPGTDSITNAISKGVKTVMGGDPTTAAATMGISWLPIAAGLTAYGISRIVKHYRSLKFKEAKLKKLQQLLPKIKDPKKKQHIQKVIQNLQIDVNAQKSVLRQQKQESLKQVNTASQVENSKKGNEKNQEKLKDINKSKQVLSKIN